MGVWNLRGRVGVAPTAATYHTTHRHTCLPARVLAAQLHDRQGHRCRDRGRRRGLRSRGWPSSRPPRRATAAALGRGGSRRGRRRHGRECRVEWAPLAACSNARSCPLACSSLSWLVELMGAWISACDTHGQEIAGAPDLGLDPARRHEALAYVDSTDGPNRRLGLEWGGRRRPCWALAFWVSRPECALCQSMSIE